MLLFAAVLVMTQGCGDRKADETLPLPPNEIRFWHFRSDAKQKQVMQKLVEQFEQENGCKVQMTELSWSDGKTKLFAAFNSNTAPDVLELGSDWVAQFSYSGVLLNCSRYGFSLEQFAEFTHAPALYRDSIYALPWTVDTRVLFFNKDLLKKVGSPDRAPKTTTEMLRIAQKVQELGLSETNGGSLYGFGANGSDEHRLYKKILPIFWSAGGTVLDSNGRVMINSPQNVEALELYLALARAGVVETQRQLDNMFVRGNIAFWISGSWLLDKIARENPALNYGVALIPAVTLKEPPPNCKPKSVSFGGVEYLAINHQCSKRELARKLVLYLSDGKNALELFKQFQEAGFPADKRYINDKFITSIPHRSVFAEQLIAAQTAPIHPHWLDMERVIEDAVVEALYGRRTAQEALDDAQFLINDILTRP